MHIHQYILSCTTVINRIVDPKSGSKSRLFTFHLCICCYCYFNIVRFSLCMCVCWCIYPVVSPSNCWGRWPPFLSLVLSSTWTAWDPTLGSCLWISALHSTQSSQLSFRTIFAYFTGLTAGGSWISCRTGSSLWSWENMSWSAPVQPKAAFFPHCTSQHVCRQTAAPSVTSPSSSWSLKWESLSTSWAP